jgi:glycosyltransferase involved in cell wall biosynthesis
MTLKKVIGLTLGDPYNPASRSGVNNAVFSRLGKQFDLDAYDCSLRGVSRFVSVAKSFSFDKLNWKRRSHQNIYAFERRSVFSDRILERYRGQYDAVYQDGAMFLPRSNDKLFVTNHDANVILTSRGGASSVGSHYARDSALLEASIKQEHDVYMRADRIFVRSHWVKESLIQDFHIDENKIQINPSGVHLEGIDDYEKAYGAENILFVGSDSLLKGYDLLLKSFDLLLKDNKNLILHIVGNTRHAKDTHNIKYYGYLGGDKKQLLRNLYLKADLFILPSRYDAFPKVLIEAGAFKVPCIATSICGIPEIIEHGKNGYLVPPDDYVAIANYAQEILSDTSLSKNMGNVGYSNYIEKFNWDRHVKVVSEYIQGNS